MVKGIPASLQSSSRNREGWKDLVKLAARDAINEEDEILGECRGILVYFYFKSTDLDADNIIKPISDALCGVAYGDDSCVSEWVVRKTNLGGTEIVDPPPALIKHLAEWLEAEQPFVYICIRGEGPNHAELPK